MEVGGMRQIAMLVITALVLAGCGSASVSAAPDHSATEGARRIVAGIRDRNYEHVWERLHADDQERVSRETFLRCYANTKPAFTKVGTATVMMDWPDEEYGHVYGVKVSTSGDNWGMNPPVLLSVTAADGEWKLLLTDNQREGFRYGDCPSLWPTSKR